MDSQWFNQAATKMDGHDYTNAGNKIDLNLKLGLPDSSDHDLDFDQIPTNHPNLDIDALYSHEGMIHYKMVNGQGMTMANIGQSYNPNEIIPWPPSNLMGSQSQYSHAHAQAQYMPLPSSNDNYGFISPSPPLHIHYPHNNNNFNIINPIHNLHLAASAAAAAGRGMRRPRRGTFIDPYKRCTNYNCNTNDTPMWRRGPLGPKSLCNACGIKYRKEEEKRMKAKEEADKSSSQNPNIETA